MRLADVVDRAAVAEAILNQAIEEGLVVNNYRKAVSDIEWFNSLLDDFSYIDITTEAIDKELVQAIYNFIIKHATENS